MKNILVIGATGQIGSELTLELRKRYGDDHVVAGYIPSALPQGILKSSGPSAIADVTDRQSIEVVCRQFKIDTIYNLAALLCRSLSLPEYPVPREPEATQSYTSPSIPHPE